MASNQQPYGYPPPPPPPAQAGATQNAYSPYNPQAAYSQPLQTNGRGRGGAVRGRGGSFTPAGRGDFNSSSSSQYNPQTGGYNASGGYGAPAAVSGGYGTQNSASYATQPPASGYPSAPPPPQWQHEAQHHQQPGQAQTAPPPIPLSAQNYHPNYAPQVYQSQATVYGQPQQQNPHSQPPQLHQQQPQYLNSPQPQSSFAQNAQTSQTPLAGGPSQQQWGTPMHHAQTPQTPYNSGRGGRGRGSGYQGRGGFDAPLMGPPIRMGFDNDHQSQASNNGFPPSFTTHGSPPVNVSSPSPLYQNNQNGYRSQDYSQRGGGGQRGGYNRAPLDPNPFYGNNRGGRGGFSNRGNFNNRGRGDMQSNGFKPRYNSFKGFSDNRSVSASESASELPQKPGIISAGATDVKKKKQKKKRKTNTLGLTPGTGGEDSASEDDADEETRLASLVTGLALMPADLQSWLAERKRKWPTAAVREARAAELAKRREQAREQSIRDKAKAQKEREERAAIEAQLAQVQKSNKESKKSKKHTGESKLERQQRKADKLRKQLEKAEKKLQSALQAGSKRKREAGDDGDDNIKLEDQSGDQVMAQAEDDDSSSDSSSSTDSDSDDESEAEPVVQSSHKNENQWAFKPHPLLHTKPCKYFSSGGTCGKMNKCRFIHDQAARDASLKERARDGGRVSLAELLLQNEKDKENLTVLKAIQYVAENGLLNEPQQPNPSATGETADETMDAAKVDGEAQIPGEAIENESSTNHEAMTDMA